MGAKIFAGVADWRAAEKDSSTEGLFCLSTDKGEWRRVTNGLPNDVKVRALAFQDENTIFAGTQLGPYKSTDGGESWTSLNLPAGDKTVWSILLHPTDRNTLFVGTTGTSVYRSKDGGASWQLMNIPAPKGMVAMGFPCRVIRMAADPNNPDEIYVGLEVGGVVRTLDGGDTWSDCSPGILELAKIPELKSQIGSDTDTEGMMDTHALTVSAAHPGTVVLATRMGLFRSDDKGETWRQIDIETYSELTYARDVQVFPHNSETLYAAFSDTAVGEAGSLFRSEDFGQTWKRFDHGISINSTLMIIAMSRKTPNRVYCGARRGQIFGTEDGGASWKAYPLPAGVEGVYALGCA